MVTDITKFFMTAHVETSTNISCQSIARLAFENITQVLLQGLQFIGCGSNEISSVESFTVQNSSFIGQNESGTALNIKQSNAIFENCSFLFNIKGIYIGPLQVISFWRKRPHFNNFTNSDYAFVGGATMVTQSNLTIFGSRFNGNHADIGGAIFSITSTIIIKNSIFTENGGCKKSKFCFGGVMYSTNGNVIDRSSKQITIVDCLFYNNTALYGGVLMLFQYGNVSISRSRFHNNVASNSSYSDIYYDMGVMGLYEQSKATIDDCEFLKNGQYDGAVVAADNSAVTVRNSTFRQNVAEFGSAVSVTRGNVTVHRSIFHSNHAFQGGAFNADGQCLVTICDSVFDSNLGELFYAESETSGGAITMSNGGRLSITRTLFHNNTAARGGAISASSNVKVIIVNCSFSGNGIRALKGGAIELSQSDVTFYGKSNITNNTAVNGGAVYAASDSVLSVYGELLISENAANLNSSGLGGGVYLYRAKFNCQFNSSVTILKNKANSNGGGIFAINSIVTVFSDRDSDIISSIDFINNTARKGGGIYLELAAELHVIKSGNNYTKTIYNYRFIANSASGNGGAIYNADETNYEICSSETYYFYNSSVGSECFLQIRTLMETFERRYNIKAIAFTNNSANGSGQALYGGLLDRCTLVPSAEIYLTRQRAAIQGIPYILNVSNLNATVAITSSPVALCFCEPTGQPNCSYQVPPFNVKKGEKFQVSLVAVDQANKTLPNVTVYSSLKHAVSGLDEGQMAQVTAWY
jgi:predicted outer membrane repeat protein